MIRPNIYIYANRMGIFPPENWLNIFFKKIIGIIFGKIDEHNSPKKLVEYIY